MRRTSSTATATATAAAVALLLAACGGGEGGGGEEDGAGGTSSAVPAPAPAPEDDGSQDDADDTDAAGDGASEGVAPPATSLDEAGDGDADGPLEVTIAAAGDILAHSRLNLTANAYAGGAAGAYDYTPMFEDVSSPISEADLALCHLETPLSPDGTNLSIPDTLVFNTPREMADALAGAGFDGCDFASNHTMDMGVSGLAATEQVVRDAGMGYAGPTADEERSGRAEVYEVEAEGGPARVAHLAYTYTYPNSGTPTTDIPGEAPWLADASWPTLDSAGILEQAGTAREEGADFVVVSMHWGNEYQAQPTEDQTRIAHDLLGSGEVDLILGTHVHVIQPCEEVDGRHVIYGLGNFLSNQSPDTNANLLPATQEGMVATFTLTRDEEGEISSQMDYRPTRVEIVPGPQPGPHVIRLVSPENFPETWERTTATVDLLGGCGAEPVRP